MGLRARFIELIDPAEAGSEFNVGWRFIVVTVSAFMLLAYLLALLSLALGIAFQIVHQ